MIEADENISLSQSILLRLQHVLAMDIYALPFVIVTSVLTISNNATVLIQLYFQEWDQYL